MESPVIGMISEVAGMTKLIVVKDPHNHLNFVYRIIHESNNLDAVAIVPAEDTSFDGRARMNVDGLSYRLGKPQDAVKLLRGKTHWIQDKGSVLSVLLDGASQRNISFAPRRIPRSRLQQIPQGVPTERLSQSAPDGVDAEQA